MPGFTLLEVLIVCGGLGAMTLVGFQIAGQSLAMERVETAMLGLTQGLERGRIAAQRNGRACAMSLFTNGTWQPPGAGNLVPCATGYDSSLRAHDFGSVQVEHNLPSVLRISSNGLVLDGGTIRISSFGSSVTRCLVISLPLGVVRWGTWQENSCRPEA